MSLRKAPTRQGRGGGSQPGDAPRDSTIPDPAGTLGRFGEVISATGPLPPGLIALSLALAAGGFAFDLSLPLGVACGIPYVALVLVGLWGRWRRYIFVLAALASALTVLGYFLSPAGGEPWMALVNRGLALFAIWAVAILGDRYRRKLARKSALLETTFANVSQGFAVFDGDLKLTAFNQNYVDLRGYPPGLVRIGAPFEEIARFRADRGDYGPGDAEEQVKLALNQVQQDAADSKECKGPNGTIICVVRDPLPGGGCIVTVTDITERKWAEQEIAAKSALLETTFESMSQGVVAYDGDLKLVAYNQNYIDFCGYRPGFIRLGMSYEDIVRAKAKNGAYGPVADIEELVRERVAARRKGNKVRRERTLPDGRVIAVRRDPMPDGGYVTTFTDITERKKAEQEIAAKSALLETTFENMSQGISVFDADLKCVAFNRRYADLWGYPPGFIRLGMPCEEVVRFKAERGDYGSGDVERKVRERLRAHRAGEASESEFALPNGKVIYFSRNPLPGGGSVTTYTDITERKRAEEEIAEKSALLETTFESMSQGIVVYDADLKLFAFNQRYLDLWAYPAGFIRLGMSYEEVARFRAERGEYGTRDVEEQVSKSVAAMRKGDALRTERTLADGTVLALRRDPLPDGGIVATFTDITERKKAEREIAGKSALLETTFENMNQGIIVYDSEPRLLAFNRRYVDLLGYPPDLVRVGMPLEEIMRFQAERGDFGPGDVEEHVKKRVRARRQGAGASLIERKLPSGAVIAVHRDPMPDGGYVTTYTDITERKKAEQEVAAKSALLETTFENMSQGISVLDTDHNLVAFNQKYLELWDFPPGFIRLGMPCEEIARFRAERGDYGIGDVEDLVKRRGEAKARRQILRNETTLPNGRIIALHADPMSGGGYVTTYTDITERKRAEEALRESGARLANAQRIARLGNWERDLETGEVHWSDQMHDIFAITPDQFTGTYEGFLERVHPDDRELIEETARRALNQDYSFDVEYRIVRPDTSERVIHAQGEVELDAAGKPVRLYGTAQDITERKSLEERIRQIQKLDAVGKLAGGVAHEFNNLLFVLRGNLDLLGLRLDDNPELRQFLETMTRQTRRGSYLTHLLVAYASQQPLRPKKMNINDVIRETTKLLEGSLSDAIEIDTVCTRDLWTTMVDRGELECAIVNLAVNAQDAMPEGGKLTVETTNVCVDGKSLTNGDDASSDEYVKLAMTDTGCGMAAVIVERAFEPFFTTKEVGKGTGLGLSMVYGFVNQSGGYVTIDSEPNNGTTVSIYLPKAVEAQA